MLIATEYTIYKPAQLPDIFQTIFDNSTQLKTIFFTCSFAL